MARATVEFVAVLNLDLDSPLGVRIAGFPLMQQSKPRRAPFGVHGVALGAYRRSKSVSFGASPGFTPPKCELG